MSRRAQVLRVVLAVSGVDVISWPDGMDNLAGPWDRLDPAVRGRWELLAELLRLDELGQAHAPVPRGDAALCAVAGLPRVPAGQCGEVAWWWPYSRVVCVLPAGHEGPHSPSAKPSGKG